MAEPSLPLALAIWAAATLLDWRTTRVAVARHDVGVERHPLWRRLLARGGWWFEAGYFAAAALLALVGWVLLGAWGLLWVALVSVLIGGGGNLVRLRRARRRTRSRNR